MTFRDSNSRTPGSLVCLQHSSQPHLDTSPKSGPILELHNRAGPNAEAHHHVNGPNTGRNFRGRQKKKLLLYHRDRLKIKKFLKSEKKKSKEIEEIIKIKKERKKKKERNS